MSNKWDLISEEEERAAKAEWEAKLQESLAQIPDVFGKLTVTFTTTDDWRAIFMAASDLDAVADITDEAGKVTLKGTLITIIRRNPNQPVDRNAKLHLAICLASRGHKACFYVSGEYDHDEEYKEIGGEMEQSQRKRLGELREAIEGIADAMNGIREALHDKDLKDLACKAALPKIEGREPRDKKYEN